jgi:hypothetical protein
VIVILAVAWGLYMGALHPWLMNWGATDAERRMTLPGDDPAGEPADSFTRAVTIEAPPAAVWPWLVQIGQDRAGFYSYTWLENLTGADIHNAGEVRPEWQRRSVGDKVPMAGAPLRRLGGEATLLTVRVLKPEREIGDLPGRFVLLPRGDGATRLLLREPLAIPERGGLGWVVWDPLHFVMEQRMLRGIKERAEGQPLVPHPVQTLAWVGWTLAGMALVGVFLARRRRWPWLVLPVAAAAPALWLAGDPRAALAGFLAVGVTVAGGLVLGRSWWLTYPLIAAGVLLLLVVAPDAYVAFGLLFLVGLGLAALAGWRAGRATAVVPSPGVG